MFYLTCALRLEGRRMYVMRVLSYDSILGFIYYRTTIIVARLNVYDGTIFIHAIDVTFILPYVPLFIPMLILFHFTYSIAWKKANIICMVRTFA